MIPVPPPEDPKALGERVEARRRSYQEQAARARELRSAVPPAELYAAIAGVELDFNSYQMRTGISHAAVGHLVLRRLTNPPGRFHVGRCADSACDGWPAALQSVDDVSAELAVGDVSHTSEDDIPLYKLIAQDTAMLLKLRGHSVAFCAFTSSVSLDTIAAAPNRSVRFDALDNPPDQLALSSEGTAVSLADAEWAGYHLLDALSLRDRVRRFDLAFSIAYEWNHTQELRVAMAMAWAGLEALFGSKSDRRVTALLASRISEWVTSAKEEEIKGLYNWRCAAVHGRDVLAQDFPRALQRTVTILYGALARCIEEHATPLPDEADT